MKVSVSLLTYNHAAYIRQAIESVLMQATNFDFELLIGEDESSDGTREIVKEYAARHPDKIRAFLNERKNVIYVNGRPTSRANSVNNLRNCRGQYVALMDGDDYWTSPHKLQRLADHLDAHPDESLCFHASQVAREGDTSAPPSPRPARKPVYTLAELIAGKIVPLTSSVMFRNGCFGEFPEWYYRVRFGDLPLYVLCAQHGNVGFLNECLGVYRIHQGGLWSLGETGNKDPKAERSFANRRDLFTDAIESWQIINAAMGREYDRCFRQRVAGLHYDLAWLYQCRGDWRQMRHHLLQAAGMHAFPPNISGGYVWKAWLIAFCSPLYRAYQSWKTGGRLKMAV